MKFLLMCCKLPYIAVNYVTVDGRQLVSCGNDGFLKIFDMNTGSEVFANNSSKQLKWVVSYYCMLNYNALFRCYVTLELHARTNEAVLQEFPTWAMYTPGIHFHLVWHCILILPWIPFWSWSVPHSCQHSFVSHFLVHNKSKHR